MTPKPKYITELEGKVEDLQKSHNATARTNGEILNKLNTIEICLKGTEFDEEEGGLVKKVNQNSRCIERLKRNMAKRDGIIASVSGILAGAITVFLNWIFNKSN